VWQTDNSYVGAAFGRARVELARGNPALAVQVLDSVPPSSMHFIQAQVAAITARVSGNGNGNGNGQSAPVDVIEAGQRLEALGLDAERREQMEAQVLEAALTWTLADAGGWPPGPAGWDGKILGQRPTERELRLGLERTYRALAHLAKQADDRIALVERANSVRPRTLI
jgi:serine/threonine-protein kinase PknG